MPNQVLTDQEIVTLSLDLASVLGAEAFVKTVRDVEAKVLAKTGVLTEMGRAAWNQLGFSTPSELAEWMDNLRRVFREGGEVTLGYETRYVPTPDERGVTEREARTRERAAYFLGFDDGLARDQTRGDLLYPLPTKRVPRTVTLSCGLKVSWEDVEWVARDSNSSGHYGKSAPYNLCSTPADARHLADLVERPYDEVPDDA